AEEDDNRSDISNVEVGGNGFRESIGEEGSLESFSSGGGEEEGSDDDEEGRRKAVRVFAKVGTRWGVREYRELVRRAKERRRLRSLQPPKPPPKPVAPPFTPIPVNIPRPRDEQIHLTTKYKKPVSSITNLVREPQHSWRHEVALFRSARSRSNVGPWVSRVESRTPGTSGGGMESRGTVGSSGRGSVYVVESQGRVV
ncbi:hypothetical protein HK097_005597, partial [Rhizophlyctis rosea]